jgi:cytochrome c oxidase subunit IV
MSAHGTHSHGSHDHGHGHGHATVGHIVPLRTYLIVWIFLMVLLVLTVAASRMHLGTAGNWGVLLVIAVVKTVLVALFFMHVKYAPAIIAVTLGAAVLWLGVLFGLTFSDYYSRSWTMAGAESDTPASAVPLGSGEYGAGGDHRTGEFPHSPR